MDAPGTLHHIMGRGIERTNIFRGRRDREDFLSRLATLCTGGDLIVYAFALMSNHFHILARTGRQPLSKSMRKLLTGYVVNFNKRHRRAGHLFQNRYKSIVCEDEPYLLELTRYIHLNPLRAGLVADMSGLRDYPWSGHAALHGTVANDWQDLNTVLAYFGSDRVVAREEYENFVAAGVAFGRRPELVGGGLVRSLGDWSQVVSRRRRGEATCSDTRILGGSDFVDRIITEAEKKEQETLRLRGCKIDLPGLLVKIASSEGVDPAAIYSGIRKREVTRAKKIFSQIAVRRLGFSGAEVARLLGVSTSAVTRLVNQEELVESEQYANKLL